MTAPVVALSPTELRQRSSEKLREHPEGVLPLFVAEADFPLAPSSRTTTLRTAGSNR